MIIDLVVPEMIEVWSTKILLTNQRERMLSTQKLYSLYFDICYSPIALSGKMHIEGIWSLDWPVVSRCLKIAVVDRVKITNQYDQYDRWYQSDRSVLPITSLINSNVQRKNYELSCAYQSAPIITNHIRLRKPSIHTFEQYTVGAVRNIRNEISLEVRYHIYRIMKIICNIQ